MAETPTLDASLADLVGKAAEALEKATATYGPEAVALALEVGRIAALHNVGGSLILLGVTCLAAALARRWWVTGSLHDGESWDGPWPAGGFMVAVIVGSTAAMLFVSSLSIHAWVGMFRPEIYLAYEAIF